MDTHSLHSSRSSKHSTDMSASISNAREKGDSLVCCRRGCSIGP